MELIIFVIFIITIITIMITKICVASVQTKEAQLMVAEMELSKVDNKTKVETTLQEQAAIQQENKEREQERERDAELAKANQAAAASSSFDTETLRDTAPLVEGHRVRCVSFRRHQRGVLSIHFLSFSVDECRYRM